jgi:protocatechuate 3,4-dioxygenase beta subunit
MALLPSGVLLYTVLRSAVGLDPVSSAGDLDATSAGSSADTAPGDGEALEGDELYTAREESAADAGPGREGDTALDPADALASAQSAARLARDSHYEEEASPADEDGAEETDEEDGPLSISGWVRERNGAPVAGLDVMAAVREIFGREAGAAPTPGHGLATRTDGSGFFTFRGVDDGIYELETEESERFASTRTRLRAGQGATVLVVEERETLLSMVYGTVSTPAGAPLKGVSVVAVGQIGATSTDAEGGYELDLASTGEARSYTLRFLREDHREQRVVLPDAELRANESLRVDVALEPSGEHAEVGGRVTSRDGQPVAGAQVELASDALVRAYHAFTDFDGGFRISEVETGPDYRLWVQARPDHRDHVQLGIGVPESGLQLPVSLERLGASTLAGRMVDADGRPLGGVTLWLRSGFGDARGQFVTGDADGHFVVEDLPEGPLVLQSRAAPLLDVSGIELPAAGTRNVELVLDIGRHDLAGQVLDRDGQPVPGSELSLAWTEASNGIRSHSRRSTLADDQGRFAFTRLGPGEHTLDVRAAAHRSARLNPQVGPAAPELIVRLDRSGQ